MNVKNWQQFLYQPIKLVRESGFKLRNVVRQRQNTWNYDQISVKSQSEGCGSRGASVVWASPVDNDPLGHISASGVQEVRKPLRLASRTY